MNKPSTILTDSFNREHTYLRISLTERCNLRCNYCMPEEGIKLSPKSHIMNYDELFFIAKNFVDHGVNKIRLTGGEPLIRKDFPVILEKLAELPVELGITTNGVIVDQYIDLFKKHGVNNINVSLDSLNAEKFRSITRRNFFNRVHSNIFLLAKNDFNVKINVVLIKGFNEDEIVDFVELGKELPVSIRFIEFMPFNGNKWDFKKLVSYQDILSHLNKRYSDKIHKIADSINDTSKNFQIEGYKGTFAIISSVTNPFCDSCNRIRLTANGHLKNCLFSASETDLLTPLRNGLPIEDLIEKTIRSKFFMRGGMDTMDKIKDEELHSKNRSMISIGG